ncbi:MAG TPA: hypothetical protein ENI23_08430 [bacterium]|nr:hypothetical protein [bacterium]
MINKIGHMDDFLVEYERVLERALSYGATNVPLTGFRDRGINWKPPKKFIPACHRGWEKVQNRIIDLLQQISCDKSLDKEEKVYRQLLLRKIVDTMANTMLGGKTYVLRRIAIHGAIPPIDLKVIKETQRIANRDNHESRLTFSLIADLTTFVHVCDLLKIDFRQGHRGLSLIELKDGRVNEILLSQMERYPLEDESLDRLKDDNNIRPNHKQQATRILRQKIRLDQVHTILRDDKGIDPEIKMPIAVVGDAKGNSIEEENYGQFLAELIESSKKEKCGVSSGMINCCLHLGVGYSSDTNVARRKAIYAASYSMKKQLKNPMMEFTEIRNRLLTLVTEKDMVIAGNLFEVNLHSLPVIPFLLWPIPRHSLFDLMKRSLVVMFIFDLPGFFLMGKQLGVDLELSTRSEADSIKKRIGVHNVVTFGNRMVTYAVGDQSVKLASLIPRFFTNLSRPAQFLSLCAKRSTINRSTNPRHAGI